MNTTTANAASEPESLQDQRLRAETQKLLAETQKLLAEQTTLLAEQSKLSTEALKMGRERAWYPAIAMTGSLAAGAALVGVLGKFFN